MKINLNKLFTGIILFVLGIVVMHPEKILGYHPHREVIFVIIGMLIMLLGAVKLGNVNKPTA